MAGEEFIIINQVAFISCWAPVPVQIFRSKYWKWMSTISAWISALLHALRLATKYSTWHSQGQWCWNEWDPWLGVPFLFGGVFLFPQCTIAWMNYPFVEPSGPRPPNFSSPPQLTYPTTHLFQPETLVPASTPLFPKPQYLINHQGFCFVFVYLFVF